MTESNTVNKRNQATALDKKRAIQNERIILHELIHFLYQHHNKGFYDVLTVYMPGRQEQKQIDHDLVLGIRKI